MRRLVGVAVGVALVVVIGFPILRMILHKGVGGGRAKPAAEEAASADQPTPSLEVDLDVYPETLEVVVEDSAERVRECREAAEKGDGAAQLELGDRLKDGTGVKRDLAEAAIWYRRAAEQGVADAQFELGMCYLSGQGVQRDLIEGLKWLDKAADAGHGEARTRSIWLQIDIERIPPSSSR